MSSLPSPGVFSGVFGRTAGYSADQGQADQLCYCVKIELRLNVSPNAMAA
jgi:hypothetical protein